MRDILTILRHCGTLLVGICAGTMSACELKEKSSATRSDVLAGDADTSGDLVVVADILSVSPVRAPASGDSLVDVRLAVIGPRLLAVNTCTLLASKLMNADPGAYELIRCDGEAATLGPSRRSSTVDLGNTHVYWSSPLADPVVVDGRGSIVVAVVTQRARIVGTLQCTKLRLSPSALSEVKTSHGIQTILSPRWVAIE